MSPSVVLYPERIREPSFRQGAARPVDYAEAFTDREGRVEEGSKPESDLIEIVRLLKQGSLLPDRFYRNGIGRDHDELLETYGIKHLHLGGSTADILLFLVEYPHKVLLLEISGHQHFASKPVGSILQALHKSALSNSDEKARTSVAAKLAEKIKAVRAGRLPRKRD